MMEKFLDWLVVGVVENFDVDVFWSWLIVLLVVLVRWLMFVVGVWLSW